MLPVVAALLGAAVGSCLAALASRWPRLDRGFALGRSRCESCGTQLAARDLVPLWSWLRLGGRCRQCGATIGALPLLAELAAAGIAATAVATLEPDAALLFTLVGWWLLLLALIDAHHGRLPDRLTLPLAALGAAAAALLPGTALVTPLDSLAGALLGYGLFRGVAFLYRRWRGRDGLGGGDAKLLAALGAWLGLDGIAPVILIGATLALGFAIARGLRRGEEAIAFGPWLAAAGTLLLWWRLLAAA